MTSPTAPARAVPRTFLARHVEVTGHHLPIDGKALPSLMLRFTGPTGEPLTVVLSVERDELDAVDQSVANALGAAADAARYTQGLLDALEAQR